jgi:hypothetical protein
LIRVLEDVIAQRVQYIDTYIQSKDPLLSLRQQNVEEVINRQIDSVKYYKHFTRTVLL